MPENASPMFKKGAFVEKQIKPAREKQGKENEFFLFCFWGYAVDEFKKKVREKTEDKEKDRGVKENQNAKQDSGESRVFLFLYFVKAKQKQERKRKKQRARGKRIHCLNKINWNKRRD